MCMVFAGQPVEDYAFVTRSVRLGGFSTSVKLEAKFWRLLEEIAHEQGISITRFLAILNDEAIGVHGEVKNFASFLRCSCLVYLTETRRKEAAAPLIAAE
jgi:predicted DNA-binding ribbon-helix-helix protein